MLHCGNHTHRYHLCTLTTSHKETHQTKRVIRFFFLVVLSYGVFQFNHEGLSSSDSWRRNVSATLWDILSFKVEILKLVHCLSTALTTLKALSYTPPSPSPARRRNCGPPPPAPDARQILLLTMHNHIIHSWFVFGWRCINRLGSLLILPLRSDRSWRNFWQDYQVQTKRKD